MKKVLCIALCFGLLLSYITGCSNKQEQKSNPAPAAASGTQAPKPAAADTKPEALTLPIAKTPIKLTAFAELSSRSASSLKSYNDMLAFQEMQKRTGIQIEFRHPPTGQLKEQFNLMLASNDLTDLIFYQWQTDYPGGPEKALKDGAVIELTDYIKKYSPNFSEILGKEQGIKLDSMTDTGKFYMYPLIKLNLGDRVSGGFQIRRDWVEKLGLKIPTNKDEWYNVLKAFKEKDPNGNGKADEIPFISFDQDGVNGPMRFTCLWGIGFDYYLDTDGKIKYGPAEPAYKNFLEEMRKWYKDGLIDPDFLMSDRKTHDAKVTSGQAGAYYGLINSFMGTYSNLMKDKDPKFLLWQAPYPVSTDGKAYNFTQSASRAVSGEGFAISSKNKYPVESAKWCDYFYSDAGKLLMNLGVEGTTYTMVNGQAKYTELVTKNPDKLPIDQAAAHYAPAGTSARLYQDPRYWEQVGLSTENQREASKVIMQSGSLAKILPPITPTPEESSRMASIQNEINTYVREMYAKFILGQEDIANFDKYVNTIKSMKLADCLDIQQKALERYKSRGK